MKCDFRDMPTQANDIVFRMKNDTRIDYDNDWKMVSLFVGGNDLCASCENWVSVPIEGQRNRSIPIPYRTFNPQRHSRSTLDLLR